MSSSPTTKPDKTDKTVNSSENTLVESVSQESPSSSSTSCSPYSSSSYATASSQTPKTIKATTKSIYITPKDKRSRRDSNEISIKVNDDPFVINDGTNSMAASKAQQSTSSRPKGFRKRDYFHPQALNLAFSRQDWFVAFLGFVVLFVVVGVGLGFYGIFVRVSSSEKAE